MIARSPWGCQAAASSQCVVFRFTPTPRKALIGGVRYYAKHGKREHRTGPAPTPSPPSTPAPDHLKSALIAVEAPSKTDPINPPRSTIPPPLNLPTRGSENAALYWFRIGRAYGNFYKDGVKAVWFNYKATKKLKERITHELSPTPYSVTDAVAKRIVSRSEFQLLARNSHDIGKLPVFGFLVLIFGEWLPLLVPFIPHAVPGTCRIPKQVRGMRAAVEERRLQSFRMGVTEPDAEQMLATSVQSSDGKREAQEDWSVALNHNYRKGLLGRLRDDQLFHLSSVLGLHARLWDRVQLPPPVILLRRALDRHLQSIAQDDILLLEHKEAAQQLTPEELYTACEQRGIDVLGRKDADLRQTLARWLQRQESDRGAGGVMLTMLFRRPNAWVSKKERRG